MTDRWNVRSICKYLDDALGCQACVINIPAACSISENTIPKHHPSCVFLIRQRRAAIGGSGERSSISALNQLKICIALNAPHKVNLSGKSMERCAALFGIEPSIRVHLGLKRLEILHGGGCLRFTAALRADNAQIAAPPLSSVVKKLLTLVWLSERRLIAAGWSVPEGCQTMSNTRGPGGVTPNHRPSTTAGASNGHSTNLQASTMYVSIMIGA
jgi:hypothetical protein